MSNIMQRIDLWMETPLTELTAGDMVYMLLTLAALIILWCPRGEEK